MWKILRWDPSGLRVDLKSDNWCPSKRNERDLLHTGRRPHGGEGRDWNDAATRLGPWGAGGGRKDPPLGPREGSRPHWHLDLKLWPPELWLFVVAMMGSKRSCQLKFLMKQKLYKFCSVDSKCLSEHIQKILISVFLSPSFPSSPFIPSMNSIFMFSLITHGKFPYWAD